MNQATHIVRHRYWQDVIDQCLSRPKGTTTSQWCKDNGINRKSYYYWQRKLRDEAYAQNCVPAVTDNCTDIAFAEINVPAVVQPQAEEMKTTACVKRNGISIEFTNEISADLLSQLLKEVLHA